MASQRPQQIRWVEEAEDPELEARLVQELEHRRRARREVKQVEAARRRSRRLFRLIVLVMLALVVTIGYGVVVLTRSLFL